MKLINQVKPEVLDALEESKIAYSSSYRSIIASLSNVNRYRDLSINQVDNIITFLPNKVARVGEATTTILSQPDNIERELISDRSL